MENLREIILDALLVLEKEGGFSNQLIKDVLDKYDYLDRTQKAFMKRVLEGTIERKIQLDFYLNGYSKTPVAKMKPLIRCLLRMSTYQILFCDSIPDSAVCNEACKLAEKRGFRSLKGFVNGVLRTIAKNKEHLPTPGKKDPVRYLSIQYSMPTPIVELFLSQYGMELAEQILESLLQVHAVSIRISERESSIERENLCREMEAQGIQVKPSPYHDKLFSLYNLETVSGLPGFSEGKMTVQDSSSALAVLTAGIGKEDTVVDLCAAPGGKSMLAAEFAKQVLAFDISEGKCAKISENVARMGLTNVVIEPGDARTPKEDLLGKADCLLLDVPCSGLGIIGKKRDIKYHFDRDKLQDLYALQKEIVRAGVACLKPGGILIYSTCTLNEAENQLMADYIERELLFEPVSIVEDLPKSVREEREQLQNKLQALNKTKIPEHCMLFLPGVMQTDGFFFAKFRRVK